MKAFEVLKNCLVEKDVENCYKQQLLNYFGGEFTSPYQTDGVLKTSNFELLLETKLDTKFSVRTELCKVLVQILFYLKRFEMYGDPIPNFTFCGSKEECFFIDNSKLVNYLEEDINWNVAPSSAAEKNPNLVRNLYTDSNVNPHVFLTKLESFSQIFDKLSKTNVTVVRVKLNETNMSKYFSYFRRIVTSEIEEKEMVSAFLGSILDPNNYYLHPKKNNVLVTPSREIRVKSHLLSSLLELLSSRYTVTDKVSLVSIQDRLVTDHDKRASGMFYTPTIWVLEAHKLADKILGSDWRDRCVVWDPAWGTGNLTRDFKFKELYCSTISQVELDLGSNFNPGSVKFQYDFLNDDVTKNPELMLLSKSKLEERAPGLVQALKENKEIVFFMNPPFGEPGPRNKHATAGKEYLVRNIMKDRKVGGSRNLYFMFLYRILLLVQKFNLSKVSICSFGPPNLVTMSSVESFRRVFFQYFKFESGFMFNLGHFYGTSNNSAILFNIWTRGIQNAVTFPHEVKELKNEKVVTTGVRYLQASSRIPRDVCEIQTNNLELIEFPCLSSGLEVKDKLKKVPKDSLGHMQLARKVWDINDTLILSAPFIGSSFPILESNFFRSVTYFAAQRCLKNNKDNWTRTSDEFLEIDESQPEFEQLKNDAVILSIFDGQSHQSSLRQVKVCGKTFDIKNHFFWLSKETMMELANESKFEELYEDARTDNDRFVYRILQSISLTDIAKEVLNLATELVFKSFEFRILANEEEPKWFMNCWDAGWYQINKLLKKYMKDEIREFKNVFESFKEDFKDRIYKLNFLPL